jgi:hypothetical protein
LNNNSEADSAAPRMQSALPLDVLADELGAAAGRIERELRLKDEARAARFEARLAAIELAAFKAEEERQRIFAERLAELRNGRDGEPGKDGKDGKDADISWITKDWEELYREVGAHILTMREEVSAKLAEVKDGKDGEPGKDADIEPLISEVNKAIGDLEVRYNDTEAKIIDLIQVKLAEVKDGKDGEPGEDGEQGPPGKDGKDGKLPVVREWTNRVHYAGDVVRHGGATYQALADTGSEPPHGDWGELASRGTDGRGFVLRGTYDAATEYRQHDIVMLNRNSFAAKYDAPGDCPGDGWQLFGPSGQRGKEGPPGAKGTDGRSVSIASLEADADAMVLRITDSLGKTFSLDLEPIAERIVEAAR